MRQTTRCLRMDAAVQNILIVEDDPFLCEDLAMLLEERLGLEVVTSPTVAAALNRYGPQTAFAFLDVNVLDGTSMPVAEALSRSNIPFAFISGGTRSDIPDTWRHVPFFRKPISSHSMVEMICERTNIGAA